MTWSKTVNSGMLNLPIDGKTSAAINARTKPSVMVPLIEVNGFMMFLFLVVKLLL
jgi:hypothetical protein